MNLPLKQSWVISRLLVLFTISLARIVIVVNAPVAHSILNQMVSLGSM
jgi:hypothetical protein